MNHHCTRAEEIAEERAKKEGRKIPEGEGPLRVRCNWCGEIRPARNYGFMVGVLIDRHEHEGKLCGEPAPLFHSRLIEVKPMELPITRILDGEMARMEREEMEKANK